MRPQNHPSGNAIVLGNRVLPAMNIQVENIEPGYDIYFEIMFENGSLWVVECDKEGDSPQATIYPTWHLINDDSPQTLIKEVFDTNTNRTFASWEEFLGATVKEAA
jgi:hypothetical protein